MIYAASFYDIRSICYVKFKHVIFIADVYYSQINMNKLLIGIINEQLFSYYKPSMISGS